MKEITGKPLTLALVLASVAIPLAGAYAQDGAPGGNRYYMERYYAGEISAAKAYVDGVLEKNWRRRDSSNELVILDVRTTSEYQAGHPAGAYHMPYPRIYRECVGNLRTEDGECQNGKVRDVPQDPEDLFDMVEELFPDKDQPLATLCRTGARSVLTANVLSSPETFLGHKYKGRGYTRVYNIWQGFVGQPMSGVTSGTRLTVGPAQDLTPVTLADGSVEAGFAAYALDLDNDGLYPSDGDADDKDGWRYHQGLPYSTRMLEQFINEEADEEGYYDLP